MDTPTAGVLLREVARLHAELEVGAEEWPEAGVGAEVAGGIGAEQPDQGLGDDSAAHGTEVQAASEGLGFGQDVVPERRVARERGEDRADV